MKDRSPSLFRPMVLSHVFALLLRLVLIAGFLMVLGERARSLNRQLSAVWLKWPNVVFVLGPTPESFSMPYSYERMRFFYVKIHWMVILASELVLICLGIALSVWGTHLVRKYKIRKATRAEET